jgi:hypothetical protein
MHNCSLDDPGRRANLVSLSFFFSFAANKPTWSFAKHSHSQQQQQWQAPPSLLSSSANVKLLHHTYSFHVFVLFFSFSLRIRATLLQG